MTKTNILLNKPIYIGPAVLDLSKVLMAEFHYDFIRAKYGNRAELLFTDTDSLCYHIHTDDVYADFRTNPELFDTSDYPANHPNYSTANKKVIGKFKDEAMGKQIVEFVGLRVKMYSMMLDNGKNKKAAKGVKKSAIEQIKHQMYRDVLMTGTREMATMNALRSYKHQIYTIEVKKVSLSNFDNKRWIADDGIHTLAYGY